MQTEKIKKNECPTCGHQNDIYTQFCIECGTILEKPDFISNKHSELLITDSVQRSFNSDFAIDITVAEKVLGQSATNRLGQDTPILAPSLPPASSARKTKSKRNRLIVVTITILTILIAVFLFSNLLVRTSIPISRSSPTGLGEFKVLNGELLGVNDGSFAPFLSKNDGQLKQQAADQLKQGHTSQAISLWQAAIHVKNNDAEAWIYVENQRVLLSGVPYFTLVAIYWNRLVLVSATCRASMWLSTSLIMGTMVFVSAF
ncbi:MAG: zinc ribbon domain-containing protein [Ktedonobacteraceae bacterium]|nr:zinc ribbon domain-containing protein [Ktedonobacteraceae bacterium]